MNQIKWSKNRSFLSKGTTIGLFILGLILFTTGTSLSETSNESLSRDQVAQMVNTIIDTELQKTDITGATAAVYYKGSPLVTRGIGYADEPNQIMVNEHTGFRIGSITKLFTALSVMKLVEEGLISLDDSIFDYLPDYQPNVLPGVNPDNRIRDLLTHHNGIPSLWLKDSDLETPSLEPLRALPRALSEDYLVENRREVFSYTNAAFALAGLIVERVSGQSYDDFIEEHFFDEFEMEHAHVFLPENRENIALPHEGHESFESIEILDIPAGSVIASASDMHQFINMTIDTWHDETDDLIEDTTLKKMAEYQNGGVKYDHSYFMGLGFMVDEIQSYRMLSHDGGIETFASEIIIIPDLEIGVFISTNGIESSGFSSSTAIHIIEMLIESQTGKKNTDLPEEDMFLSQIKPLPLTGNFLMDNGATGDFKKMITLYSDGQTSYIIKGTETYELQPLGSDRWSIAGGPAILNVSDQFNGYYIKTANHTRTINLIPITPYSPSPENWDRFLGREYVYRDDYIGELIVSLKYDAVNQFYYTHFTTPGSEFIINFIQRIISDKLLQGQGKGRNASLVTRFIGEDTVMFCGLEFQLDKRSRREKEADATMNSMINRAPKRHILNSIFGPTSTPDIF